MYLLYIGQPGCPVPDAVRSTRGIKAWPVCVPCRIKRSSSSIFIIFTFFFYNYARLNIYTNAHKTPGRLILPGKKSLLIYKGSGQKMYSVPMEIPQFCNKCPFGICSYSIPPLRVGSCFFCNAVTLLFIASLSWSSGCTSMIEASITFMPYSLINLPSR